MAQFPTSYVTITTTLYLALSALPALSCPPVQNDFPLPLRRVSLLGSDPLLHTPLNLVLWFPFPVSAGIIPRLRMVYPLLLAIQDWTLDFFKKCK